MKYVCVYYLSVKHRKPECIYIVLVVSIVSWYVGVKAADLLLHCQQVSVCTRCKTATWLGFCLCCCSKCPRPSGDLVSCGVELHV